MQLVIPILLILLVVCSIINGTGVYESFVNGAKKALPLMVNVLPFMAAMLCAINIFRDSGCLELLTKLLKPAFSLVGIPSELTTLILLRPFSGSAAMALLNEVLKSTGVDSYPSFLASIMLGSTETIFYSVALYFGSIGVTKTRHAVIVAVISGIVGVAASVILAKMFY